MATTTTTTMASATDVRPGWRRADGPWVLGTFVVATLIATVFTQLRFAPDHVGEEPMVAAHVARGQGFRSPLSNSPTAELTAWVPPGYPVVAATAFRLFGVESRASLRVLVEANCLCYGLMVAGVVVIGCQTSSRAAGLIGAALVVVNPLFLLLVHRIWDTYFAQAILVWLTVAALAPGATWRRLIVLGAGMGLLVQFNGSFLLVGPVLGWMAVRDLPVRQWLPLAAVATVAFGVVLLPWTARNYVQFHKVMYVRRGAELEMWMGNRPGATGWQELSGHPATYKPEHDRMVSMGEAAYFALCGQRFRADYAADPAAFWRRTARRAGMLVVGQTSSRPMEFKSAGAWAARGRMAGDVALFAVAAAGLIVAWRLGYRTGWVVPLSAASVAVYVVTAINYRFSMQVKLFLSLMVGFLIWATWRRATTGTWPRAAAPVKARGTAVGMTSWR